MTEDERTLASLKLLRESSAWMVGVQTAVFGFLITLLNADKLQLGSTLIKAALTSFLLSILLAGMVLGAIPWLLNRQPVPTPIRKAPIAAFPGQRLLSIGWVSGLQYAAFTVGIVCLAAAMILRQIG